MRFQVPQFIDIEDKIFGPLTIKQFIYLAGSAGLAFVSYVVLPTIISFLFIIPIIVFGVALAFYRPQDRPFINMAESAFNYFFSNKLYIWKKQPKTPKEIKKETEKPASQLEIPKLSDSKLSDLSWSLDIKEKLTDNINNN